LATEATHALCQELDIALMVARVDVDDIDAFSPKARRPPTRSPSAEADDGPSREYIAALALVCILVSTVAALGRGRYLG